MPAVESNLALIALPLTLPVLVYTLVTAGVLVLVLFGVVAKRWDAMDDDQARVFSGALPGLSQRVVGLLLEGACQTLAFTLQFAHVLGLLSAVRHSAGGTPVVVLPGYTENAGTMWWLARRFAHAGFSVYSLDFPSTFQPIEQNVMFLRDEVRAIRAQHEGREVVVVGHSMGGVVARALCLSEADHGIALLVAFASPFRGANIARVGAWLRLGASVAQMCPGSEFNRRFGPERAMPVPTLAIISTQEDIVTPEWSTVAAGIDVRVLPQALGHEAPLFLREPFEHTRAWLAEHGVEPAAPLSDRPASIPSRAG